MTSIVPFSMFFDSNLLNRVMADGILPGIGLIFGLPVFVLLVLGEGFLISKILRVRYKLAIKFTFWANIISALVGNPFFLLVPLLPSELYMSFMVPASLYEYCRSFLYYSVLAYLLFLLLTVIVEWLYALWWRRKGRFRCPKRVLLYSVVLANVVGYLVLCPVHYYFSSPFRYIREISEDSRWAGQPCQPILYVSNNNSHLMRIDSNGANSQVLVPYPVKHFLCSKDMGEFVFFESGRELYHYNRETQVLTELWKSSRSISQLNTVQEVALSPSGNRVAWIVKTADGRWAGASLGPDHWELFVTNIETNSTRTLEYRASGGKIAWSNDEHVIYLNGPPTEHPEGVGSLVKIKLAESGDISIEGGAQEHEVALCDNYGRVGRFYWRGGGTHVIRETDGHGDMKAFTIRGLASHIRITRNGRTVFRFAYSPSVFPLALGTITEPSFISGGKECVFEYGGSLFLVDIENRRVGKIADGSDHIVLTQSYQKRKYFFEN